MKRFSLIAAILFVLNALPTAWAQVPEYDVLTHHSIHRKRRPFFGPIDLLVFEPRGSTDLLPVCRRFTKTERFL
jgi:hypothetical protein